MRRDVELTAALALELAGAAGALLIGTRTWQTVVTTRPAPLRADVLSLSGRDIDAAPTALALVALAGIVAVLATRGLARRIVGVVVALAGLGIVWRSIDAGQAISARRARTFVPGRHPTVDASSAAVHVQVHTGWAVLSAVCGLLVAVGGALVAWRGGRWRAMSARYERRPRAESAQAKATTLWTELDRGEDPTR